MILIVDNYDSFTYNLVQYFGEFESDIRVYRNDAISVDEIAALAPDRIVISPGPCTPNEAGISMDVIATLGPKIPLLGVCLGHQSIGAVYGGDVVRADIIMHGKVSEISHNDNMLFKDVPSPFSATRYHSLVVKPETCPDCLEVTARTADGVIMGIAHKEYPIWGVQFHPESILTTHGKTMIRNFVHAPAAHNSL